MGNSSDWEAQVSHFGDAPRILLMRQDRLGDVVMSTPIMIALRTRYPQSRIYVLLGKNNAEAEPLLPIDCEVMVYRKSLLQDLKMLRALRSKHIDIAVDLTDKASVTASILISQVGAKLTMGIEKENGSIYDIAVPRLRQDLDHISERTAELLRPFGIDPTGIDLRPRLEVATAKIKGRVGFNVSARVPERCSPPRASAEIALGILGLGYKEVVIFAGPKDKARGEEVIRLSNDPRVRLATTTATFPEFAEQIATCQYLITTDTSAIQLGAAGQVPMVVLFNPTPGEHPWTPKGVPFELHVQLPRLENLEPQPVLRLFEKLADRVAYEKQILPSLH